VVDNRSSVTSTSAKLLLAAEKVEQLLLGPPRAFSSMRSAGQPPGSSCCGSRRRGSNATLSCSPGGLAAGSADPDAVRTFLVEPQAVEVRDGRSGPGVGGVPRSSYSSWAVTVPVETSPPVVGVAFVMTLDPVGRDPSAIREGPGTAGRLTLVEETRSCRRWPAGPHSITCPAAIAPGDLVERRWVSSPCHQAAGAYDPAKRR